MPRISALPLAAAITPSTKFPTDTAGGETERATAEMVADFVLEQHAERTDVVDLLAPQHGVTGDGATDDAAAIQAVLDALTPGQVLYVPVPSVRYRLTAALELEVANVTILGAGTAAEFRQVTADTPVFRASGVSGLRFFRFSTYGEGAWSAGWTGNEGHDDRGIELTNCADFVIEGTKHRNHALAGIALRGSCSGEIRDPVVEGTHAYSTALSPNDNFQMGVLVTYGPVAEGWGHIRIVNPEISGTNQGILLERGSATVGEVEIITPYLHDIIGQHGCYIQSGNVTVVSPKVRDCGLAAVKIQTGLSATSDVKNVTVTDLNAQDCAGNAVEIAGLDETYSIRNVRVTGVVENSDRLASIVGLVDGATVELVGRTTTGHGVFIGDSSALVPKNITVRVKGQGIGKHGVYISTASGSNIVIEPDFLDVGAGTTATYSGVLIEGATASPVTILNPRLVDTGADMLYGIFASNAANLVRVHGRCVISGYTNQAVRATGRITEFPEHADIGATVTVGYTDQSTVRSSAPVRRAIRSTSASSVTLWSETLDDEGAYAITVELVGKLSGSAERASFLYNLVAYRDGGGAAIEGTPDLVATTASASFAGVVAFDVSSNNVRLRVNSGGTADYDWQARISVVRMTGSLS
jgi:hypothetical protein